MDQRNCNWIQSTQNMKGSHSWALHWVLRDWTALCSAWSFLDSKYILMSCAAGRQISSRGRGKPIYAPAAYLLLCVGNCLEAKARCECCLVEYVFLISLGIKWHFWVLKFEKVLIAWSIALKWYQHENTRVSRIHSFHKGSGFESLKALTD